MAIADDIQTVSVTENDSGYQLTVDMDQAKGFSAETLAEPFRLELRIQGPSTKTEAISKHTQQRLRKFAKATTRNKTKNGEILVFETIQPMLIRSARYNEKSTAIVLDLVPTDAETFASFLTLKAQQNALTGPVVEPTSTQILPKFPLPKSTADTKRVIVIDAGHGGIDPGALGKRGTKEKDVVLAFANELKKAIEFRSQFEVQLSRTSDKFLSLPDRVKFARDVRADLLISLHADIVREQTARGATLYTLSETASDKEAEAFANKENKADLIAGLKLPIADHDVTEILANLMQRETQNHSNFFARKVTERMHAVTKMTGKPVRSADFAVLTAPDVPAALIELGFLSSLEDEKLLTDPKWRQKVASAMAQAVDDYFSEEIAVNSISRANQGN